METMNIQEANPTSFKTKSNSRTPNDKKGNSYEQTSIDFDERLTNSLTEKEISEIIDSTRKGFGMAMGDDDIIDHVCGGNSIFTISHEGKIIGFSSVVDLAGVPYLAGIAIHSEYQKRGIYTRLHKDVFQEKYEQVLLRTQNLSIIQGAKKSDWEVFIGEEAWRQIEGHINQEEISKHPQVHEFKNGVFPGAYKNYLGSPERVNYIDDTVYPGFQPERGDSLLVLLRKKAKTISE